MLVWHKITLLLGSFTSDILYKAFTISANFERLEIAFYSETVSVRAEIKSFFDKVCLKKSFWSQLTLFVLKHVFVFLMHHSAAITMMFPGREERFNFKMGSAQWITCFLLNRLSPVRNHVQTFSLLLCVAFYCTTIGVVGARSPA